MAKQALGKNLGALLGSAAKPVLPGTAAPAPAPAALGAGVRSLVQGGRAEGATPPATQPHVGAPAWYFFGGDFILTQVAVAAAWTGPHPMGAGRAVVCALLVLAGAGLGVAGLRALRSGTGAGVAPDGIPPK